MARKELSENVTYSAHALQSAADRCCHLNKEPATRKQIWFAAFLMDELGTNSDEFDYSITHQHNLFTKRDASHLIDTLIGIRDEKQAA